MGAVTAAMPVYSNEIYPDLEMLRLSYLVTKNNDNCIMEKRSTQRTAMQDWHKREPRGKCEYTIILEHVF